MVRTDRSKIWIHYVGGLSWLAGAGLSVIWMLHGGGPLWSLFAFFAWATLLFFVKFFAVKRTQLQVSIAHLISRAVRWGALSALGLALGTLFLTYWPVTVTMVCMFAICRTFKDEDSPAYI